MINLFYSTTIRLEQKAELKWMMNFAEHITEK